MIWARSCKIRESWPDLLNLINKLDQGNLRALHGSMEDCKAKSSKVDAVKPKILFILLSDAYISM